MILAHSILNRGALRAAASSHRQPQLMYLLSGISSVTSSNILERKSCIDYSTTPTNIHNTIPHHNQYRTILSSSSFSSLPPEEEAAEKARVDSLTPYQKEMELRQLETELQRLNTLRAINTGELYTLRGKFKMLSRDYGMGFLAWYWTCWFATAGLSYAAIELGGVDPLIVANKIEMFLGWENNSLAGRLDPTLGQIGLVVAVNECLEPLRLPFVVFTTKPVVNAFSKKY